MAAIVTTFKIMPSDEEVNLEELFAKVSVQIKEFVEGPYKESPIKKEIEKVFGPLSALKITFSMDEKTGDTERLEKQISELEEVESVTVVSQGRALG